MGENDTRSYNEQNVGKSKKKIETMKVLEDERFSEFTDEM